MLARCSAPAVSPGGEIAELVAKNIARTAKIRLDGYDNCYLKNIC